MLDGTDIVRILGTGSGDHVTLLIRGREGLLVTRVFLRPVPSTLDAALHDAVCAGQPFAPDVPGELVHRLTGFQARASLGPFVGLPDVLGAGVSRMVLAGLPQPAASYGYAHVATRFIEGTPLVDGRAKLSTDAKIAVLDDLARLLADLQARGLVHMALAPSGVVADDSRPWVVDLAPLCRKEAAPLDHAPALGRLAAWLLEPELSQANPPPECARWLDVVTASRQGDGKSSADHETEVIADRTPLGRRALSPRSERESANAAMPPTEFVPDADDRELPGRATIFVPEGDRQPKGGMMADVLARTLRTLRRRGFVVAASVALVVAIAAFVVIGSSSSHSPTSADARGVAAEAPGEQQDPPPGENVPWIEARPRCIDRPERGSDGTMTVRCAVRNQGPFWTRVRVTAWLYDAERGGRRVGAEDVLLAPSEPVTLQFDAPEPAQSGSRCDCRVEALR